MKKIKGLLFVVLLTALLTSCWDQRIYEKVGFILNVGIERAEEDKLLITLTNPVVGIQQQGEVEMVTTIGNSLREAREYGRLISPKNLEGGKIQHILLSCDLAEGGLHNLLELFQRDPINPALAIIVVVDGSPKELIEKSLSFTDKPRSAFYISQLLENNIRNGYIPETRIFNFDIAHFAPGLDPITPMIRLDEEGIRIIGSALFSGDRMVGRLDIKKTSLLLAAMDKMGRSTYVIENYFDEGLGIQFYTAVLLRGVKRRLSIDLREDKIHVNIALKFDLTLDDYRWDRTDLDVTQRAIEEAIASAMETDYMQLFSYLQEVGSDPVGIGDMVRAKHKDYWSGIDEWQDAYRSADFNFDINVEIKQYGAIK